MRIQFQINLSIHHRSPVSRRQPDHQSALHFNRYQINREILLVI